MIDNNLLISYDESIKHSLSQLNKTAMKVLFVVNRERQMIGSLTDGDIRRALLNDISLESSIEGVYNTNPVYLRKGCYKDEDVKALFLDRRIEVLPIVDENFHIESTIAWTDCFREKKIDKYDGAALDIPVVIMAGGKGSRLAPFTTVLPKPLIPIGDKTIIELIMDGFLEYGISNFIFTLNYRGEMIRAYFEGAEHKYPIQYVREDDFYGTAGSLALVKSGIEESFIVSNCDIIVKANYAEVLDFHRKSGASLTIISSLRHHKLPYGVVDFKAGGEVLQIKEKPEFTFPINTGVYVLEKSCLDLVPEKRVFHMTHLIEALLAAGKKVVTYPVNENEYIDIGQWDEYRDVIARLSTVNATKETP